MHVNSNYIIKEQLIPASLSKHKVGMFPDWWDDADQLEGMNSVVQLLLELPDIDRRQNTMSRLFLRLTY